MGLEQKHLKALRWAVREAGGMRGYWIGNPNQGPLTYFDAQLKNAKEALTLLHQGETRGREIEIDTTKADLPST